LVADDVYPEMTFEFNLVTSLLVTRRRFFCEMRMTFVNCVCIGTEAIAAAFLEVQWFGSDQPAQGLNRHERNSQYWVRPYAMNGCWCETESYCFSGGAMAQEGLVALEREVTECRKCPRLVRYREEIARTKRRAYRDWTYWGRPVPAFGDPEAGLVIIGLAPAAHGANRTGRMFTGDRSGDFLFAQLHRARFANQAHSKHTEDGLVLKGALISAAVRCAPPDNKPLPEEIRSCLPFLERELGLLHPRAILALGGIAFNTYLDLLKRQGLIPSRARYRFAHGASFVLPRGLPRLFAAYHPSQQNTQTGRLTPAMFARVLRNIQKFLKA
jgi:uracil-DNA glycosylase family 4